MKFRKIIKVLFLCSKKLWVVILLLWKDWFIIFWVAFRSLSLQERIIGINDTEEDWHYHYDFLDIVNICRKTLKGNRQMVILPSAERVSQVHYHKSFPDPDSRGPIQSLGSVIRFQGTVWCLKYRKKKRSWIQSWLGGEVRGGNWLIWALEKSTEK